jgi:hypothetical protein
MAEQLVLVKRTDLGSDVGTLNLLTWLSQEGWQMSLGDGETAIDEAMTLHVPGTSDNDLAVNIQALDALLVTVKNFSNPLEPYGIWLRSQLPGETGARQALILEAKRDKAQVVDRFAQQQHMLRDYVLGLKRTAAWEDTADVPVSLLHLNTVGGMAEIGTVLGDVAARVALAIVDDFNGGASPFSNIWIAFRSNRFGAAANFVPCWEAELGHVTGGAAITNANDDTASGGQEIEYTETPTVTFGAFTIDHPRVKTNAIEVTAVIDGNNFVLTPVDDYLSTTVGTATAEDISGDTTLDEALPTPGTIIFNVDGTEFAHDDGAGVLVMTIGGFSDTWYFAGAPYTRQCSVVSIVVGSVTGFHDHLTDHLAIHDDGNGNLLYDNNESVGEIDYDTGDVIFFIPDGSTITLNGWYWTNGVTTGTIDYISGAWSLTGLPSGTQTANYNHGLVRATFNYTSGAGLFTNDYLVSEITSLSVVYTGYHNKSVRVTFTVPEMSLRWYMSVSEAAAFPADQVGKMLVLGRMKVSDGTTVCRVRLESGFAGTRAYNKKNKIVVEGDDWTMYALGQVMLPETGRSLSANTAILNQILRISAERYAGSGTLDLDCLILIPIDEGFISVAAQTDPGTYTGPDEFSVRISRSADERISAAGSYGTEGPPFYTDVAVQATGGPGPGENVHVILAAQRETGSDIEDEVNLALYLYRRWLTLRGAE